MGILDFIFPVSCLECNKLGNYLCQSCLSKVELAKTLCPNCKINSFDGFTHARCRTKNSLDRKISIFKFEKVVRKGILDLKYKFVEDAACEIAELCVKRLSDPNYLTPSNKKVILVPIPLHRLKKNWRGFNQSESIGKHIAKSMDWEFASDILVRKDNRISQTGLSRKKREENIKGAFILNAKCWPPNTNKTFVLFDDVWTTGSTIKEACKVLKKGGAKTVWGLTIAA